jgi:hypothetical protein
MTVKTATTKTITKVKKIPIIGSLFRQDALLDGVVEDLTLLAAELANVLGEVAGDELLATEQKQKQI